MINDVHRLTLDDLPDCLALATDRGWGTEEHKWRLLFSVGTVYGVRDEGRLVGTTILTRYGDTLAAISMVLVATSHGRRGIGGALMSHAMAQAGDAVLVLNATEYGRPLYERLGFVTVGRTYTMVGVFVPDGRAPGSRPASVGDLPAIRAFDAQVNGVDRGDLVGRLPAFCEQLRVIERDGVITGYAGAWRNDDLLMIGPVLAGSIEDALTLIGDVTPAGVTARMELDEHHPLLREWAQQRGLELRFSTTIMTCGGQLPGDRERWFAPVMQALG